MTMRGLSLIETLLYIALLSILMGGALAGAYAIADSAERNKAQARMEQEGVFLLRSIRRSLQGGDVLIPLPGSSAHKLSIRGAHGYETSIESADGMLSVLDNRGSTLMSSHEVEALDIARSGIEESPEHLDLTITLAAPAKGGILRRTFHDTFYLAAP